MYIHLVKVCFTFQKTFELFFCRILHFMINYITWQNLTLANSYALTNCELLSLAVFKILVDINTRMYLYIQLHPFIGKEKNWNIIIVFEFIHIPRKTNKKNIYKEICI